ncbi:MAG: alpha/beta hydrolase [Candidatus Omnitrophica bacterium]|nr:alpha/beta hydrolase [Candidatus Omnitrophota bacterium]
MNNNLKKMPLITLKITIAALILFGLLLLFLRYIETRTLFYPTKEIPAFPDRASLEYQDVFFKTTDNLEINGWFVPCKDAQYTILFCHGNAGNISHRIGKLKFFNKLGYSVFIIDYRGYGKSQGRPSEAGFYKDAKAAYNYLLSLGISADQIIGYGESIGGAVIVDLAWKEKMKALILDSTLSSVKDMIKYSYPFVPYWVFSSRFDSESKIKSVKIPKLIIHSINDEIVPFQLGKRLYEASPEPKEFLQIYGGHNSNFYESEDSLRSKIGDFIKTLKEDYHTQ